MRKTFHGELAHLDKQLITMGHSAAESLRLATRALLTADLQLAEQLLAADADLDRQRAECEEHAQALLALQAPVASDLRAVLTAVYCADKIERMGDLAAHIAATVRINHPERAVPAELEGIFVELGAVAAGMADRVTDFIAASAGGGFAELEQTDRTVDALHAQVLATITGEGWTHGVRSATNLALLARFYERFADQAVSVARRVEFAATGDLPDPQAVAAGESGR